MSPSPQTAGGARRRSRGRRRSPRAPPARPSPWSPGRAPWSRGAAAPSRRRRRAARPAISAASVPTVDEAPDARARRPRARCGCPRRCRARSPRAGPTRRARRRRETRARSRPRRRPWPRVVEVAAHRLGAERRRPCAAEPSERASARTAAPSAPQALISAAADEARPAGDERLHGFDSIPPPASRAGRRGANWRATMTMQAGEGDLERASGSTLASATPPNAPPAASTPMTMPSRTRTLPYPLLAPRPDEGHRDDRQQRSRLGADLRGVVDEIESRNEHHAAAHAEQAATRCRPPRPRRSPRRSA